MNTKNIIWDILCRLLDESTGHSFVRQNKCIAELIALLDAKDKEIKQLEAKLDECNYGIIG